MASTPTAGIQPTTIHLTYHPDGSVTCTPRATFQKGDLVTFVSDSGGDAYVKLSPHAYKPSQFTPQSGPVKVIGDPVVPLGTTSPALCGIVIGDVGYGWLPDDVRSKLTKIVPMSGIETEP